MKVIWNKLKFSSEELPSNENNVQPLLFPQFLQQKYQQFYKQIPIQQSIQCQQPLLMQPQVCLN